MMKRLGSIIYSIIFCYIIQTAISSAQKSNNEKVLTKSDCKQAIYFKNIEYDCKVLFLPPEPDTISSSCNNKFICRIVLLDCKGAASVVVFDSLGNKSLEGQFVSAGKLSKINVPNYDVTGEIIGKTRVKCYIPVKDGEWNSFYEGALSKQEYYSKGVLVKRKVYLQ